MGVAHSFCTFQISVRILTDDLNKKSSFYSFYNFICHGGVSVCRSGTSKQWFFFFKKCFISNVKNVSCCVVSVSSVSQIIPFLILSTGLKAKETVPILDNDPEGREIICLKLNSYLKKLRRDLN